MDLNRIKSLTLYSIGCLILIGCGSSVSKYFSSNQYVEDANNFLINDSLQFLHKTYGDVRFTVDEDSLILGIPKDLKPLRNVIGHGSTEVPPFYDYYILLDSKKRIKPRKPGWDIRDTIINGHSLTFIGIPKNEGEHIIDFNKISSNLFIGKEYRGQFISLFDLLGDCFSSSNRYLKCLSKVNSFPATSAADQSFKRQMQLTFASFMGTNFIYDSLLNQGTFEPNPSIQEALATRAIHGLEKTLVALDSICREEHLVMFNENHFHPNHRKLLTEFLPIAKSHGFSYLALEALSLGKELNLNKGMLLESEDGFYTREQNFMELITLAQELGFTLISYDEINSPDREIEQAKNIYDKTFLIDSLAKVLVYAGISHIQENGAETEKKWMAQIFKENYIIDPLTISQTALIQYEHEVEELALIESSNLEDYQKRLTDYALINNLKELESIANFEYVNRYTYPVQISFFIIDSLPFKVYPTRRLPVKSYLLDINETYRTKLDSIRNHQCFLLDSQGNVLEDILIQKE